MLTLAEVTPKSILTSINDEEENIGRSLSKLQKSYLLDQIARFYYADAIEARDKHQYGKGCI